MSSFRQQYREYLRSEHWQQTRTSALERAGYKCECCRAMTRLDVHHKTYERLGAELPEDLEILCRGCHGVRHWNDPSFRTSQSASRRASWTLERKVKASAQSKARWADPEYRAKQIISRKASWNETRRKKYRQASTGEANHFYGKVHTDETRSAISKAQRKAWSDPEYRKEMSEKRKGQTVSSEQRAKIGSSLKGRIKSPEERANISAGLKGRRLSPESRTKIAQSLKGRKQSLEQIARARAATPVLECRYCSRSIKGRGNLAQHEKACRHAI